MTDFQSAIESSLDFTMPMFPADTCDSIDLSHLIQYQSSDTGCLTKGDFEVLPWDFVGADQTLHRFAEGAGLAEVEVRSSYTTSNHRAPAGWGDYTIKTKDTLSDACLLRPEKEMCFLSHSKDNKSGSLSPVDAFNVTTRATRSSCQKSENTTDINARKASNAFTSSSTSPYSPLTSPRSSVSSSKARNQKSARSKLAQGTSEAAVVNQKKVAHNIIERRYRTNMNAKFQALGSAIPRSGGFTATQLAYNKGSRRHSSCQPSSHGDNASGPKGRQEEQQQLNKSEILTNALDYIHELQDENSRSKRELSVLKQNLLPRGDMKWRQ